MIKDIQTLQALICNVWMVYRCDEFYLWRFERVLLRELNVDIESTSFVRAVIWALNCAY